MLTALERRWSPLFATAVFTGMRKGELLALRKSDVDLKTGTLRVGRSHASDTTRGSRKDLLPIAVGLEPYLREALATSPSELLFPREDGTQHRPDVTLHKVLRQALGARDWWRATTTSVGARDVATRQGSVTGCPSPAPLRHEALASGAPSPAALPRLAAHHDHPAAQGGCPAGHRAAHPPPLGPGHHHGDVRSPRRGGHAQGSQPARLPSTAWRGYGIAQAEREPMLQRCRSGRTRWSQYPSRRRTCATASTTTSSPSTR